MIKYIGVMLSIAAFLACTVGAQTGGDAFSFKAKIGFTNGQDKILGHRFFDGGKKFLVIGEKSLQIWDVEDSKLIKSIPHNIAQFAPRGFFSKYLLLNVPQMLDLMNPYLVDPHGRWIAVIGSNGADPRSLIIRDLRELDQIKVLTLPNVPTEYVRFDDQMREISTFGVNDKFGDFAVWDKETFELKRLISISEYKWHKLLKNEEKMIVGTGDTKTSWNIWYEKHGENLTLRDVKTGAVEREFTAPGLEPRTSFQRTVISEDERFLMSERNNRYFVWDISGDGAPRFEIDAGKDGMSFEGVIGGQFMAFSANKKLQVYEFAGIGEPKYVLSADRTGDSVKVFDKTEDGKYIVVGEDSKISVLATGGDGKAVYEIARDSESERFTVVEFVNGDKFLALGRVNSKEKKPARTVFYDIESGKVEFEVPNSFDPGIEFTSDQNTIYSERIGMMTLWNVSQKRLSFIPLEIQYQEQFLETNSSETPVGNAEQIAFSPDFRYSLKYGGKVVEVYDNDLLAGSQSLFDREKVKYDKKKRVKKSGLGDAGWSPDGKYVFALDDKSRTVSFWRVVK